jgi:predicted HTH domain antitoxin
MATESTAGDDSLATAVGNYVLGEISLGKAAEQAGMSRWEFEEVLSEAGFESLYGPRTRADLDSEVETVLDSESEDR